MKDKIEAKNVIIRQMSGRKCNKVCTGTCGIRAETITQEMKDLPYFSDSGYYLPDNYCRGLAAKYLFGEESNLFDSLRCNRYSCGHIWMRNDGNHRMCVLKQLEELVEVEVSDIDSPCDECEVSI